MRRLWRRSRSPTSGASLTGPVNFTGSCQDPEQGNITSSARWSSSRDGDIGTGASFTRTLSLGAHTITLTCTDAQGLTGTAIVTVAVAELLVRLSNVNFDFNQATLTQSGRDTLDRVFSVLQQRTDVRVAVEGHTDPYGSDEYNQGLSERRTQAVVTYLTGRGIAADRIVQKGFGEQCLLLDDDHARPTRSQREHSVNRRVELWSVGDAGSSAALPSETIAHGQRAEAGRSQKGGFESSWPSRARCARGTACMTRYGLTCCTSRKKKMLV